MQRLMSAASMPLALFWAFLFFSAAYIGGESIRPTEAVKVNRGLTLISYQGFAYGQDGA